MKKLISVFAVLMPFAYNTSALGQVTPSFGCPSSALTGVAFNVPISFSGSPIAGFQFTVSAPTDSTVTITPGPAATAVSKQASVAGGVGIIWGFNQNLVQPGVIANLAITTTSPGNHTFSIGSTTASDAAGGGITITANPTCVVSISVPVSKCDVNADGTTDSVDANLERDWILKTATVPTGKSCDRDGSGVCDVKDLMIVVHGAPAGVSGAGGTGQCTAAQ